MERPIIKLSRSLTEDQSEQVVAIAPGVTESLAALATTRLIDEVRQLRLREPQVNGFEAGARVAAAFPATTKLMMSSFLQGTVSDAEAESFYTIEEQ